MNFCWSGHSCVTIYEHSVCVCVLPVRGRRLCSSVGAAERSSWPAPPAGPALCRDISALVP